MPLNYACTNFTLVAPSACQKFLLSPSVKKLLLVYKFAITGGGCNIAALKLTKIVPKKKNKATYQYRESHALGGMEVGHFSTPIYPYGVRIHLGGEGRTLHFNASCAEDRRRFLEDLDEAILENGEMEALESNLRLLDEEVKQSRQKSQSSNENRDSGVPDDTVSQGGSQKCGISTSSGELCHFESPVRESMRKTTSNSSVDSGLAVSASSMSTSWPLATHLYRTTC
ncbi:hypothetical protein D918_03344 [Trichuris suis]|nr:hypothetical protein D918_03344 [Trichuris suis]